MIQTKIRFTGLEFDPVNLDDRWHRGVIPLGWSRYRFMCNSNVQTPISSLNRWLFVNIEGKWSVWMRHVRDNIREISLAFENECDGVTFVLADGKNEAFRDAELRV